MNTFSVGEAIRFGWETFKKRPWFFIGITVITAAISGAVSSALGSVEEGPVVGIANTLVNMAVSTFIGLGITSIYLKAHVSVESVSFSDLWHPDLFWNYFAASIVVSIIVGVGFILLIVPGVILALMFLFTTYLIVDKKLGPIEALKESNRITKGKKWQLLVLMLAIIGVNILGFIGLLVGLLISIPVSTLAIVYVYRKLEHSASEVVPNSATAPAAM